MLGFELEVLLQPVDDSTSASVDAVVLDGLFEVGRVRLDVAALEDLSLDIVDEELGLLAQGQNEWTEHSQVGLEGITSDFNKLFR